MLLRSQGVITGACLCLGGGKKWAFKWKLTLLTLIILADWISSAASIDHRPSPPRRPPLN